MASSAWTTTRRCSDDATKTAIKNNIIWLILAPTVSTALGLIFAVLTERVRWATAFKLVVFMPMAITLVAGIIFRLVYEQDPDKGVANAMWVSVHDSFSESPPFPGAYLRPTAGLTEASGGSFTTKDAVRAGTPTSLPLVAAKRGDISDAQDAKAAKA
ncbi:ABC transporter permease OS=Streptomyces antimycoticus OX=68175 GN=SSPO_095780 PE=3 SV=1 [Streptomyces antimycoticus]